MNAHARIFRSALTFGFGLLPIAVFVSAGSSAPATPVASDLRQEIAIDLTTGQNTEQVGGTLSTNSLFDKLFRQQKDGVATYDVPFPFTALTQRIAANLAVHERKVPSLLQVLIPLGRSLQRYAAEPEYFRYPRVIVAVDAEPATSQVHAGIVVRDRLYLGYLKHNQACWRNVDSRQWRRRHGYFNARVAGNEIFDNGRTSVSVAREPLT